MRSAGFFCRERKGTSADPQDNGCVYTERRTHGQFPSIPGVIHGDKPGLIKDHHGFPTAACSMMSVISSHSSQDSEL